MHAALALTNVSPQNVFCIKSSLKQLLNLQDVDRKNKEGAKVQLFQYVDIEAGFSLSPSAPSLLGGCIGECMGESKAAASQNTAAEACQTHGDHQKVAEISLAI